MKSIKSIITTVLVASFLLGVSGGVIGTILVNSFSDKKIQVINEEINSGEEESDEDLTVDAVNLVSPSVVSIAIFQDIRNLSNRTGPNPFDDYFSFPFEFDVKPPELGGEESPLFQRQEVGGGSGFIISSNGLIVTNKHVVNDADSSLTVILQDGSEYEAELLGVDPFNDLAVIKIEAENLPTVILGDSDDIAIGQSVIAIGNSLGEYQNTVTKGIISGVNRRVIAGDRVNSEILEEAIQTDAAINPGNSGGPLIDLSGNVIGVNTAISRSGQLIGFAIPVNEAKHVVESVIEFGRIVRPWLGVRYITNNQAYAEEHSLSTSDGAVLVEGEDGSSGVILDSPAGKAGVNTGDIILKLDDIFVGSQKPLGKIVTSYKPGDTVVLTILRDGEEIFIKVILEEFEN